MWKPMLVNKYWKRPGVLLIDSEATNQSQGGVWCPLWMISTYRGAVTVLLFQIINMIQAIININSFPNVPRAQMSINIFV